MTISKSLKYNESFYTALIIQTDLTILVKRCLQSRTRSDKLKSTIIEVPTAIQKQPAVNDKDKTKSSKEGSDESSSSQKPLSAIQEESLDLERGSPQLKNTN